MITQKIQKKITELKYKYYKNYKYRHFEVVQEMTKNLKAQYTKEIIESKMKHGRIL